jgi:large subunit ribosomal protein L18
MIKKISSNKLRQARHLRIRHNIQGTPERPRLSVYKSNTGLYIQIIDDTNKKTLFAAKSSDTEVKGCNIAAAKVLGEVGGKGALAKGITKVVFDRSGYLYHGKIAALAQSLRDAGLEF